MPRLHSGGSDRVMAEASMMTKSNLGSTPPDIEHGRTIVFREEQCGGNELESEGKSIISSIP